MERRYYDEYGKLERTHWWFRGRREILLRLIAELSLPPSPAILNVGSCTGASSHWLGRVAPVCSVEVDWEAARWSAADGLRHVITGSVETLPIRSGAFDVVAALDLIEHVPDHARGVRELVRVTRPGGHLLFTVPALPWLWSQHDVVSHHQRRYSASAFLRLLSSNGVRVRRWSYFNSLLLPAIAATRLADRVVGLSRFRGPSGSDLEMSDNRFVSPLGHAMLAAEARLLPRVRLPLGASLVAIGARANGS